jgi:diguanylate cyclase (GGDEF)-like protein
MHAVNLLVADRSAESSERINSLLRNSGIKVHVMHASTSAEIKRSLDHDTPALILYAEPDPEDAPIEEVDELAHAFNVPLALFSGLQDPGSLAQKLSSTACYVINSDQDELLTAAVSRLIRGSEHERRQERQREYLEELEHRYNLLLESSRDPVAYIHEGLHVFANRAYREVLGLTEEADLSGFSLLEMLSAGGTDIKKLLRQLSGGQFPNRPLPASVKRPGGGEFEADLLFSAARFDGEDCIQMMMQMKDAANELAAELERMRHTDPLTQMHNRKSFADQLEAHITAGASNHALAVLYIEADEVGNLQDELNVETMDAFIADLAAIIKLHLEESDVAARISDHGFAVLLKRPGRTELERVAEDIRDAYSTHVIEIGDRTLSSTCSIGMANVGRVSVNSQEIIGRARKAQVEAAQQGDQVVISRPQLTAVAAIDGEPEWVERIKFALGNNDFYSVQHPIADLDGEGQGLIDNITFMRGEGKDQSPDQYLEIADRNDLAGAIDRHVLPGLINSLVDSEQRQIVSVSNNSILDYGFPGWLADQLRSACADGDRLVLQIEASAAQTNLRPAQRLMNELKPLGCHLALSQFDASRRSLSLLEHLEVSYVKLHADIERELTGSNQAQEALSRIVEAAETRGVSVIAGEVEETASLAVLWQCGVKLITGAFLNESPQVIAQ